MNKKYTATIFAILAAALYAINFPVSKILLNQVSPTMMAAFLYLGAGLGSLIVAFLVGEHIPAIMWMLAVLVLGFISYGLSINFYIKAQKDLGAAKTSAYYAISPFLGVAFGMLLLQERPGIQFYIGLVIMIIATVLMIEE